MRQVGLLAFRVAWGFCGGSTHGRGRSPSADGALTPAGPLAFIGAAALGGLVAIVLGRL